MMLVSVLTHPHPFKAVEKGVDISKVSPDNV